MFRRDAPKGHFEIIFENVRVPFENVILGEGRGFEISQGRLGPGRIHHCMRMIGQAERCIAATCERVKNRTVFGRKLSRFDNVMNDVAQMRAKIEMCRLLIHKAAENMDHLGNKDQKTRQLLSMVKAHVPKTVGEVVDQCMQAHGAKGFSQDTPLFAAWSATRTLRMADGPDEVHWRTVGRIELQLQDSSPLRKYGEYEVNRSKVWRRSTDPISEETKKILEDYSRL
jgi:alkylation response protein AidB-like acyl-CoA dehydrogenase